MEPSFQGEIMLAGWQESHTALRSSVNKARGTAALRSGFTFELNTGSFITDKHDIIYSVVVTRVE